MRDVCTTLEYQINVGLRLLNLEPFSQAYALIRYPTFFNFPMHTVTRGGGRTGAAGAFAPVNFWQRVHCTRPEVPLLSERQKKMWKLDCARPKLTNSFDYFSKNINSNHRSMFSSAPIKFMHPSCGKSGAAPVYYIDFTSFFFVVATF